MRAVRGCWTVALLGLLAAPAAARAQALSTIPAGSSPSPSTEVAATTPVDEPASLTTPESYAAALDGSGLVNLGQQVAGHLLLGGAVSGGWDGNPQNQPGGTSAALYTVAPYVGLQTATANLRALLQYQFTSTSFTSAYATQTMHLASVHLLRSVSERWSWEVAATGRHGQDSTRFLSTPETAAVGGVSATTANAAAYLPESGTVTYLDAAVGATYLASPRDSVQLRVGDVFSRYQGIGGSNSIATTNLSFQHDVTPNLGVLGYQGNSFYYGALTCQSYGAGAGLRWRPREHTVLALSGGPQLDTASCGSQQGFAYSGELSSRITGRSQIYLLAARQPTSSYLGPGLWQQSVSAGYQREVHTTDEVSFDVGHIASSTLLHTNSYQGTYVNVVYNRRLGGVLRATSSYRAYLGDSGGLSFHRNVAQLSLAWVPGAGHLFQ